MEQQKLLWIIFALATGFLVIVAAAFVLFVPPAETPLSNQDTAATDADVFDVTDYLQNGEETLGLEAEPESEEGETSFVIGIAEDESAAEVEAEEAAEPEEAVEADEEDAPAAVAVKPAPAPQPKPAPRQVQVTEYWIQAGSFQRRSSAEAARESLKAKEFDSVIFTKSIDGTDYFRVRIGPYKYKAEAEKFLGYIQEIESFEASQIYEVYQVKTL